MIQIPHLPAPVDEYELEAESNPLAGFSDEELSAGAPNPERKPCPACGEMIARSAVKCRFCGEVLDQSMKGVLGGQGSARDPAWGKVRSGLATIYYCICIIFGAIILMVIGAMIMGGLAAAGGGGGPSPAMVIVLGIGVLAILAAGIGTLVGYVRCTNVPRESGAHGYAVGSIVCLVANIFLSMAGGATQSQAVNGIGSLVSLVGSVLFILFIRRSAAYLNDEKLAASAGKFLIFGVVMFVGAVVLGVLSAIVGPAIIAILGIGAIVGGLVAFVWYLNLIRSLMTTIDSRMAGR